MVCVIGAPLVLRTKTKAWHKMIKGVILSCTPWLPNRENGEGEESSDDPFAAKTSDIEVGASIKHDLAIGPFLCSGTLCLERTGPLTKWKIRKARTGFQLFDVATILRSSSCPSCKYS